MTWWQRKSSPVLLLWSHAAGGIGAGGTVVGAIGVIGVSTHCPDEGNSSPEACPTTRAAPKVASIIARRAAGTWTRITISPPPIACASAVRKVGEPAPGHGPTIKDGVRG